MIADGPVAIDLMRLVAELEETLQRLRSRHAGRFGIREELFDRATDGLIVVQGHRLASASPAARAMLGLRPGDADAAGATRVTRTDGSALAAGEQPWVRAMSGENVDAVLLAVRGRPVVASARRTPSGAVVVLHEACDHVAETRAVERSIAELESMRRRTRAMLAARSERTCS